MLISEIAVDRKREVLKFVWSLLDLLNHYGHEIWQDKELTAEYRKFYGDGDQEVDRFAIMKDIVRVTHVPLAKLMALDSILGEWDFETITSFAARCELGLGYNLDDLKKVMVDWYKDPRSDYDEEIETILGY